MINLENLKTCKTTKTSEYTRLKSLIAFVSEQINTNFDDDQNYILKVIMCYRNYLSHVNHESIESSFKTNNISTSEVIKSLNKMLERIYSNKSDIDNFNIEKIDFTNPHIDVIGFLLSFVGLKDDVNVYFQCLTALGYDNEARFLRNNALYICSFYKNRSTDALNFQFSYPDELLTDKAFIKELESNTLNSNISPTNTKKTVQVVDHWNKTFMKEAINYLSKQNKMVDLFGFIDFKLEDYSVNYRYQNMDAVWIYRYSEPDTKYLLSRALLQQLVFYTLFYKDKLVKPLEQIVRKSNERRNFDEREARNNTSHKIATDKYLNLLLARLKNYQIKKTWVSVTATEKEKRKAVKSLIRFALNVNRNESTNKPLLLSTPTAEIRNNYLKEYSLYHDAVQCWANSNLQLNEFINNNYQYAERLNNLFGSSKFNSIRDKIFSGAYISICDDQCDKIKEVSFIKSYEKAKEEEPNKNWRLYKFKEYKEGQKGIATYKEPSNGYNGVYETIYNEYKNKYKELTEHSQSKINPLVNDNIKIISFKLPENTNVYGDVPLRVPYWFNHCDNKINDLNCFGSKRIIDIILNYKKQIIDGINSGGRKHFDNSNKKLFYVALEKYLHVNMLGNSLQIDDKISKAIKFLKKDNKDKLSVMVELPSKIGDKSIYVPYDNYFDYYYKTQFFTGDASDIGKNKKNLPYINDIFNIVKNKCLHSKFYVLDKEYLDAYKKFKTQWVEKLYLWEEDVCKNYKIKLNGLVYIDFEQVVDKSSLKSEDKKTFKAFRNSIFHNNFVNKNDFEMVNEWFKNHYKGGKFR